jgi:hypothetical protein
MNLIKDGIGLALIFVAWFNPLKFDLPIQITLFVLGFDATDIVFKLFLFVLNFFFPILGEPGSFLTWTLLILMASEVAISLLEKLSFLFLIIKPLVVFITIFFGMNNFQLALIVAGIDLILNLKR